MMNLETFFKNHFDTKEISDDNMRKFAEVHLQRLAANNTGGEFTTLLTDTTNAYTNYFGSMTDEDTKYAVQQGLTIAMNSVVRNFKRAISQKEGLVRSIFGKESPQYREFFPFGITEYTGANLANIQVLMERFVNAATKYTAELGAPLATQFQGYLTDFIAAREAQLLKIGEVAEGKTDTSDQRDSLESGLMKNVHLIGSMFIGDVDRCMDFFDQSFIREAKGGGDEEPPAP